VVLPDVSGAGVGVVRAVGRGMGAHDHARAPTTNGNNRIHTAMVTACWVCGFYIGVVADLAREVVVFS
jgi:hypothetical protein